MNNTTPNNSDEIVISGISGRFPESKNIAEFKQNLLSGIDLVTEDNGRFPLRLQGVPKRSGKLKDLNRFDASFFHIHGKLAQKMDPALRFLLETTYEAIIDSGMNPAELKGSQTGVFIAISESEADAFWIDDVDRNDGYSVTGCHASMFPNRVSYAFDLHGPSVAVDAACSSSLVALEMGVEAIRVGKCSAAIVAGCSLCIKPQRTLSYFRLGMLSLDGTCKSFDSSANGYVRSESDSVVLIQKASDARRSYGSILGIKVNCDGYKDNGITVPSGKAQAQLAQKICEEAGIDPSEVSYVEAHGTGTQIGDREELNSITEVFCKNRPDALLIGSVKSNMGHSEASAGLCSIAKVILAMEIGIIPGNLHFRTPNKQIPGLSDGRLQVVTANRPWDGGYAAINSFGFGGTIAHVLLRSNPRPKPQTRTSKIPRLVTVSGRTYNAVAHFLENIEQQTHDSELLNLIHAIHSINIPNHGYRGYSILGANLKDISQVVSTEKRPVWFVYSGTGSQYPGMVKDLLQLEAFKTSILKIAESLSNYGFDLMKCLTNLDNDHNNLEMSIGITAMQIALTDVLNVLGIKPDGLIGHSAGETVCAYVDGVLTAEESVLVSYFRCRAILESDLEPGAMASVGLTWEECIRRCPSTIFPACHNTKDNVTISGPPAGLEDFVKQLQSEGVFAKIVNSSGCAFHSKYVKKAVYSYRNYLKRIIKHTKRRSSKWITTAFPKEMWDTPQAQLGSEDYFITNLLKPVLFYEALEYIPSNAIVIEIAPHSFFQAILKRSLPTTTMYSCLMHRNESNQVEYLLQNVGKLYNAGAQPNVAALYPSVSYPVGRGTPMISPMIEWDHSDDWTVPNFSEYGSSSKSHIITINLAEEEYRYLASYNVGGQVLFPASGYLVYVWKTFATLKCVEFDRTPVLFQNVKFNSPTFLSASTPVKLSINILEPTGEFNVTQEDLVVVSGKITVQQINSLSKLDTAFSNVEQPLNSVDIYKEFCLRGYNFTDRFCGILNSNYEATCGTLKWDNDWITFIDAMMQFSNLKTTTRGLYLANKLDQILINPVLTTEMCSEKACVSVKNDFGVVQAAGVELRRISFSLVPSFERDQAKPLLETFQFIPLHQTILNEDNEESQNIALTVLAQIITEKVNSAHPLKITCFVNGLGAKLKNAFDRRRAATCVEYSIVDPNDGYYIESLTNETSKVDKTTHVVVCDKVPELKKAAPLLRTSTDFLLLETNNAPAIDGAVFDNLGLEIICTHYARAASKTYTLLNKNKSNTADSIVIQASDQHLDWFYELKSAMIKSDINGDKIYLIAQGSLFSGIVGLVNSLRKEPGGLNIRSYLIQNSKAEVFDPSSSFYVKQIRRDLVNNVLDLNNQWGILHYLPVSKSSSFCKTEHAYIHTRARNDYSSLTWIESPLQIYRDDAQFCWIYCAALNIKGSQPETQTDNEHWQGGFNMDSEFSGRDLHGKRVMGFVRGSCLATSGLADSQLIWEVPEKWTLEEAATIPRAYVISYYALFMRGTIKHGESILIHNGTDGVSIAAINIALSMGCTVLTTVNTPVERSFLKKLFTDLRDEQIGMYNDTTFKHTIMTITKGVGVDMVLNPYSAVPVDESIQVLTNGGRFLQLGQNDVSCSAGTKNISLHTILMEEMPNTVKAELQGLISVGITTGVVRPLPRTVFSVAEIKHAFQFISSEKHTNKVLIKLRNEEDLEPPIVNATSRVYLNPKKSYIVIDGLNNFGLELIDWLINRGARSITVITKQNIKTTGYQNMCLQRWSKADASVIISTANLLNQRTARDLITQAGDFAPIGGIFNVSLMIEDDTVNDSTVPDFDFVITEIVGSVKQLDVLSRELAPQLQHFVVCSTASNHAYFSYAESAVQRLVEQRRLDGLPGVVVQWGAIEVANVRYNSTCSGTLPQSITSCLDTLDTLLNAPSAVVSSVIVGRQEGSLDDKVSEKSVVNVIGDMLGIKDTAAVFQTTFNRLGIDSILATEIERTLELNYNILLKHNDVKNLTFSKLAALCSAKSVSKPEDALDASDVVFQERDQVHESSQRLLNISNLYTPSLSFKNDVNLIKKKGDINVSVDSY